MAIALVPGGGKPGGPPVKFFGVPNKALPGKGNQLDIITARNKQGQKVRRYVLPGTTKGIGKANVKRYLATGKLPAKAPTLPKSQQPGKPPSVQKTPSPLATATPPSPLDATYFANVAAHQAATAQSIAKMNMQQQQDNIALQSALGALSYQQPLDQLSLMGRANQAGNLYSSVYGANQGNLVNTYQNRQLAAQNTYTNQAQGITAQINALQQNEPLYESQQFGAAATRAANLAAKTPGLGLPTPTLTQAVKPKVPAAPKAKAPKAPGVSRPRQPKTTINPGGRMRRITPKVGKSGGVSLVGG